jgi:uncharacterized membrane protein
VRMTLLIHILASGLGLVLGAVALSATKGARLHRKSGMLFIFGAVGLSASISDVRMIRSGPFGAHVDLQGIYGVSASDAPIGKFLASARMRRF